MLSRMDENSDLFRFDDDCDDYYIFIIITITHLNSLGLTSRECGIGTTYFHVEHAR